MTNGAPIFDIEPLAARAAHELINIIVVTATDVERDAVRERLQPLPGTAGLGRVRSPTQSFYLGMLGKYAVAHVECTMGAVGIAASLNSVSDAIAFWSPQLVLMPGIAFGMDPTANELTDVLIASSVAPYEAARIDPGGITRRGEPIPAGHVILDRLRDARGIRPHGVNYKVGLLLSGEKLVDDPVFKAQLWKDYPTAIGGDMEGAGVAAACHRHGVQWSVVKAICDWGDGKKDKTFQVPAAKNAVACIEKVLSSPELLPKLPYDVAAPAFRLLSGARCAFVRAPADVAVIDTLFANARADALFGSGVARILAHAGREIARNALAHGKASCAAVEIGEREIVLRDDGAPHDPRQLVSRLRAPGRDAGSLVMQELAATWSEQLAIDYRRDEAAGQNVVTIALMGEPDPSVVATCTVPPLAHPWADDEIRAFLGEARQCSEIYYDVQINPDLSSLWRVVYFLLAGLEKDQLLVVTNPSDPLGLKMLSEITHPQLVFR